MTDTEQSPETIFSEAIEIASPQDRADYLERACQGRPELRRQVEKLVQDHFRAGDFLESPAADFTPTADQPSIAEQPGTVIGPYKLLEQIGEGGMGVVFMAEQSEPLHRTVALKIIKPGMDTRQVSARFEAERQALALMDHPNIARVLDAGTTGDDPSPPSLAPSASQLAPSSARPYFVMELVKGVPITDYCDRERLSIRRRLELFTQVCHAVQHAHQKGIIHRDLKPSNVLVAEYDGRPVPKVIDFGVAKATAQPLTERTMFTQFGQLIGTFEYMSPEQARFNQLDVDTRSDVYSLGVLLYELLTGSTPLEKERVRSAAFDEVLRIIREEEPPKPSTRLGTSGSPSRTRSSGSLPSAGRAGEGGSGALSDLPAIAANRCSDPARLGKQISGELDWIVMKCLEKDRNRRYETANGLVADIEHYLHDEPVQACPPSAIYRFRKFARRNRIAIFAASTAVVALLLGVVGLAISNRLIAAQREQAEAERMRAEKNFDRARAAVCSIMTKAATGQGVWWQLTPEMRKVFAGETIKFYETLLQEGGANTSLQYESAVAYRSLGEVHHMSGDSARGEELLQKAIIILKRLNSEYPDRIEYRHQLGYCHHLLGTALNRRKKYVEAEAAFNTAIDIYEKLRAEEPSDRNYFTELSLTLRALLTFHRHHGAPDQLQRTGHRFSELLDSVPRTLSVIMVRINGGAYLWKETLHDQAVAVWEETIRENPIGINDQNLMAWFLITSPATQLRDPNRAVKLATEAVQRAPDNGGIWNTLGVAWYRAGNMEKSIEALTKSMELRNGGDSMDWFVLAMAEWRRGNKDTAREWHNKAIAWMDEKRPRDPELTAFRAEAAALLEIVTPEEEENPDAVIEQSAKTVSEENSSSSKKDN